MKSFYTRKGDDGYTGLLKEGRVPKNHPIPEAVGTLDESSAALGVARAACQGNSSAEIILTVQRDLYSIMAEIAASPEQAVQFRKVNAGRVSWLETQIRVAQRPGDSAQGFHRARRLAGWRGVGSGAYHRPARRAASRRIGPFESG